LRDTAGDPRAPLALTIGIPPPLLSYAVDRPPTMSRMPAKSSRKTFAPRIASPQTIP
jgi:hypothetical protein